MNYFHLSAINISVSVPEHLIKIKVKDFFKMAMCKALSITLWTITQTIFASCPEFLHL